MHQTANDSRWQLRSSYTAEFAKAFHGNGSKLCHRSIDLRGKCFHHGLDVASEQILALGSHRRELFYSKGFATRVGEEAINNASDVSDMKGRRGHTTGASIPFNQR